MGNGPDPAGCVVIHIRPSCAQPLRIHVFRGFHDHIQAVHSVGHLHRIFEGIRIKGRLRRLGTARPVRQLQLQKPEIGGLEAQGNSHLPGGHGERFLIQVDGRLHHLASVGPGILGLLQDIPVFGLGNQQDAFPGRGLFDLRPAGGNGRRPVTIRDQLKTVAGDEETDLKISIPPLMGGGGLCA